MATASAELEAQMAGINAASGNEGKFLERRFQSGKENSSACVEDAQQEEVNTAVTANEVRGEKANTPEHIIDLVADPETVEANRKLLGALGVCVVIILVQAAFNFMLYLRRPDAIVVDRTAGGDRVVVMNNREYGVTDNVRFVPDEPSVGDKKYLATRFLKLYYGNNPDIRDRQLNEAIGLMIAARGREFFEYLRRNRILEREATESWQAKWTPQQTWIDEADPFTVHVIGTQAVTRIVEQRAVEETRQLNVTVKLSRDELGRAERNGRTGYQVTWFGWKELNAPASPPPSQGKLE
ncbi:MAG: hypothetical protein M3371_07400 [Acidobacteriota bacterium]|nr:hypothetical protein [Acidobacteriota bacterium]